MANTGDFNSNVDGVASSARDAVGNVAREAKKFNSSLMGDARAQTDKVAAVVDKQGRAALSNLQHSVKEKPAMAVGIAVGAGIILGLMFSSRR